MNSNKVNNTSDIILVGLPNTGKSLLFSRITGISIITSNYPGSTINFHYGKIKYNNKFYTVIDSPGIYNIKNNDTISKITLDLLKNSKLIINVIDSTQLEKNIPLTLKLIELKVPIVIALNLMDEANYKGIIIDENKLSYLLNVPVIKCTAKTGEGLKKIIQKISEDYNMDNLTKIADYLPSKKINDLINNNRILNWQKTGEIINQVQQINRKNKTFFDYFEEFSIHPIWGSFLSFFILFFSYVFIRMIGEFLITGEILFLNTSLIKFDFGTEYFFNNILKPFLSILSQFLHDNKLLHQLLIGSLINNEIDFVQSFGLLTSGLFIPLGIVAPYIISFYLILSLLEDSGYLPRLAIFVDKLMHYIGLHGYAIIPFFLSFGCNVPGIMATRILESKTQRFIASTIIAISIPCSALQAMIIGLVGHQGFIYVLTIYIILFIAHILIGFILKIICKNFKPELLIEIPPYRIPNIKIFLRKIWNRTVGFIKEALLIIFITTLIVNLLSYFNLFHYIANFFSPLITNLWGMPKESIIPIVVGFLRKDVAIGMLTSIDLTTKQLIIGSVILSMFFPCIASITIFFKEFGLKLSLKAVVITVTFATIFGTLVNQILSVVM